MYVELVLAAAFFAFVLVALKRAASLSSPNPDVGRSFSSAPVMALGAGMRLADGLISTFFAAGFLALALERRKKSIANRAFLGFSPAVAPSSLAIASLRTVNGWPLFQFGSRAVKVPAADRANPRLSVFDPVKWLVPHIPDGVRAGEKRPPKNQEAPLFAAAE